MLSTQTPQAVPAALGMAPGIIQQRQMPEAIPGLPQGVTPEMMAQALAHPNPMIRQQAAAFLQVAQALQRQTPNLTSVAPGNFIVDPRTGQVIGQVPQMPGEAERFLSQFIALETQRGTPPEELMRKISDILAQRLQGGGVRVDLRNEGPIPQGYMAVRDENGNIVALREIPGGPAEAKRLEEEERKEMERAWNMRRYFDTLIAIDGALRILKNSGNMAAGIGALLAEIPQTQARRLRGFLDTIKANVGFDELYQMRKASPTGGALGSISENELKFLQSARASLDQGQDVEQLIENLMHIRKSMRRFIERATDEESTEQAPAGAAAPAQQNTRPPLPDGAIRMEAPPSAR
jgi:hypothetical protein